MSRRGRVWSLSLLLGGLLFSSGIAQPGSSDQPIVPNPNAQPAATASPAAPPPPASGPNSPPNPTSTGARPGIYIADTGNHRIVYMEDIEGNGRQVLGRAGHEPGYFLHPSQIWVDPLGKIFVADRDNNRIVRIEQMNGWGWTEMGGFNRPEGVASRGDEIYVADTGNHQILVYKEMNEPPVRTLKDARLQHPTGLWLDQNKDLYVTCGQDPPGGRVVKILSPSKEQDTKWEVYDGQNLKALGFAPRQMVTWKRQLWMIDPVASRLVKVDNLSGRSARELGGYGSNLGKFRSPNGLGVSKDGHLYVADTGNDRIVQVVGNDPKDWKVYTGSQEALELRSPASVFSWSPVPAPPPPVDPDKKGK